LKEEDYGDEDDCENCNNVEDVQDDVQKMIDYDLNRIYRNKELIDEIGSWYNLRYSFNNSSTTVYSTEMLIDICDECVGNDGMIRYIYIFMDQSGDKHIFKECEYEYNTGSGLVLCLSEKKQQFLDTWTAERIINY
jgi:hypothetical protein